MENPLVLAATRRLIRPTDAPPLGPIRSLAYFLPVIEEVLELRVSPATMTTSVQARTRKIHPVGSGATRADAAPPARNY